MWSHQIDKFSFSVDRALLSAQIVFNAQRFFRPVQLTAEMWTSRPLNFHTGRVYCIAVLVEDWLSSWSDNASWLCNRTNESQKPAVECCLTLEFTNACCLMTKDLQGDASIRDLLLLSSFHTFCRHLLMVFTSVSRDKWSTLNTGLNWVTRTTVVGS